MPATHHTLGAISIPRGMLWIDELSWQPVERAVATSITGAVLMDVAARLAGRPITLEAADDQGFITRATLQALQALSLSSMDTPLTFTHADGRSFSVQFAAGEPITARPLSRPELPPETYPYIATLRLITV